MSSLDNEEREFYPGTFTLRPRELTVVGSADFCCISLSKSSTLDRDRNKSGIGLFSFPSDSTIRKQWVKGISQFHRESGNDSFSIRKSTKVCEFHFPINCIRISCGYGIYVDVDISIPSVFKFKQEPPKKKKKALKNDILNQKL